MSKTVLTEAMGTGLWQPGWPFWGVGVLWQEKWGDIRGFWAEVIGFWISYQDFLLDRLWNMIKDDPGVHSPMTALITLGHTCSFMCLSPLLDCDLVRTEAVFGFPMSSLGQDTQQEMCVESDGWNECVSAMSFINGPRWAFWRHLGKQGRGGERISIQPSASPLWIGKSPDTTNTLLPGVDVRSAGY